MLASYAVAAKDFHYILYWSCLTTQKWAMMRQLTEAGHGKIA